MYESLVYAIAAIVGLCFYVWNCWPSTEPFNPQKAFSSLIRGGAFSIILSAVAFSNAGLSLESVFLAFLMGFTFDAGLKKAQDSLPQVLQRQKSSS
jgi:F0F1-type ATP synthase assembly protein I